MKHISSKDLLDFAKNVFLKIGCTSQDATLAAEVLIAADRRGIDSHGAARMSGYVRLWEAGRINTRPSIKVIHETPSTAVIDGDSGLGLVVAPYAMKMAIEKAKIAGTGWVSVQNSNHFGIAGIHAMMALENDMIGIAMTNASALVAPTFSMERMLGTNPIAIAIPAKEQPAIVADFATTTASNGKLEILQRENKSTPEGWVQDEAGNASTDAAELKKGGSLLPLGSDKIHGSHKGYALGSIVDIFSAVLSGASYGPWVPPFPAYVPMPENMPGKGLGHFFGAMRVDAFRPKETYYHHIDHWIKRMREAKPAPGYDKVLIPGDPERAMEKITETVGISLNDKVYEDLKELDKKFSIHFFKKDL
ncbi:MAG: Ldh family oxidoreductase [Bacteroidetes bacterium]|nr:Ldh family oxidoreductase [Bacteroidota bacterium]